MASTKIPFTEKDIAKIIELRRRGVPIRNIASQFKRSTENISQLLLSLGFEKGKRTSTAKW